MRPPTFEPPYDSPIERDFAYHAIKYLRKDIDFKPQFHVDTICGEFILDFLLISENGRCIGVECDGKEFHDAYRDEWRDAMILGCTDIDYIYRFKGADLHYKEAECLFVMTLFDPNLFTERGIINISVLSGYNRHELELEFDYSDLEYSPIIPVELSERMDYLKIQRNHKQFKGRRDWSELFDYAKEMGGGNLDEMIAHHLSDRMGSTMQGD